MPTASLPIQTRENTRDTSASRLARSLTSTAIHFQQSTTTQRRQNTRSYLFVLKRRSPLKGLRSAVNYLTRSVNQKSRACGLSHATPCTALIPMSSFLDLEKILYHTAVYTY
ncbi:hypothetical protein CEXT_675281 [Caerostris extrusa]|uniref:Uncharacterized protein n=1 Tax=Caerostris extrusa TaxID=172846 RepID=A0AAV4U9S1_CAEEX|nr:hypothetical protein CEXT_675281 [Caerostris extrusa]